MHSAWSVTCSSTGIFKNISVILFYILYISMLTYFDLSNIFVSYLIYQVIQNN